MTPSKRRVGVIAGATGFLGQALAKHYSDLGIDLILIARDEVKLQSLKSELTQISNTVITTLQIDFEGEYITKLFDELTPFKARIEFFICTIGNQNPISPILFSTELEWSRSIYTNLILPVSLSRLFVKMFLENGFGSLILVSGGGAATPRENFSAYAAAKAGLVRFVETFALEIRNSQVRINAIAPGVMPSQMMNEILENPIEAGPQEVSIARNALGDVRWESSRLLELCDFLISESSHGITGKLISAKWDNWEQWPLHLNELTESDLYTLRRINGRDKGLNWGDV
jgi:short-subunit dehydrogenase